LIVLGAEIRLTYGPVPQGISTAIFIFAPKNGKHYTPVYTPVSFSRQKSSDLGLSHGNSFVREPLRLQGAQWRRWYGLEHTLRV
jgi:hypothetical protein